MSINVLDFKKSLPLQGLHCRRFRRGKHALPQQLGFNDPVSPSWAVCFYFDAKISREPRSSTKRDQMWLSDPHGFAWYILILGYLNGLSWFISLSSLFPFRTDSLISFGVCGILGQTHNPSLGPEEKSLQDDLFGFYTVYIDSWKLLW